MLPMKTLRWSLPLILLQSCCLDLLKAILNKIRIVSFQLPHLMINLVVLFHHLYSSLFISIHHFFEALESLYVII